MTYAAIHVDIRAVYIAHIAFLHQLIRITNRDVAGVELRAEFGVDGTEADQCYVGALNHVEVVLDVRLLKQQIVQHLTLHHERRLQ